MESDREEEVDVSSVQESPEELSLLSSTTLKLYSFESLDDTDTGGVQRRIPRLVVFAFSLLLELRAIIGL